MSDIEKIFGKVSPPPGTGTLADDPVTGLGIILGKGINIFIVVAGLALLMYMLWGALDWITSNGEKEKISKAQNKITNAAIGMILIFVILIAWGYVAGDILGVIKRDADGWTIKIPTL